MLNNLGSSIFSLGYPLNSHFISGHIVTVLYVYEVLTEGTLFPSFMRKNIEAKTHTTHIHSPGRLLTAQINGGR